MRLDKFLKETGYGTRNEVKKLIKEKRVKINSQIVLKSDLNIDPLIDQIYVDSSLVHYQQFYYFLLNKPKGYLSATEDSSSLTILDLFKDYDFLDLFPVGRLDKDTTGAIIATNDGALAHRLISPKYHVDKIYIATLDKEVNSSIKEEFESGIVLDNEKTLPSKFEKIGTNVCRVTLHQGKYHQVKRMFSYFGYNVIDLHREKFAFLDLKNLNEGNFRELTKKEVEQLKEMVKMK